MTELARAVQDLFNPHWTETRPTVRESSPEAATVGPRKEKPTMPETKLPTGPLSAVEEADFRERAERWPADIDARLFATLDRERGINAALVEALKESADAWGRFVTIFRKDSPSQEAALENERAARAALALAKPKE